MTVEEQRPVQDPGPNAATHADAGHLPFSPVPVTSVRPWAGHRLALADEHIGELWLAGPASLVAPGGPTLDELAAARGATLVGQRGMALLGPRFPLLVKLIDAADWLSLQVHPGDALARELYGPDAVGKTEAWVVLDGTQATPFVTGPASGLGPDQVRAVIADGTMGLRHCTTTVAAAGDVLLLRAGTIHAIGAGALVYEIEQPSDLTFRISDWGRPTGRTLHTAESLRAVDPAAHAEPRGSGFVIDGGMLEVPEFRLELVRGGVDPTTRTPAGRSLEVLTVLGGSAVVRGAGWSETLTAPATLVVPAAVPSYRLEPAADALIAIAGIP